MVSKELLSEVLGEDYEILKIGKHFVRIRHVEAYRYTEWCEHKVAHVCKEWANTQNYWTQSGYEIYHLGNYFCTIKDMPDNQFFYANTEPEAVFKATSYIMEQLKQKD